MSRFESDELGAGLAIVGATFVDPVDGAVVERSAVVVRPDGRISSVGLLDRVSIGSDLRVIDAEGLVMLPGLVDCHAHLALRGSWLAGRESPTPTDWTVGALEAGRRWVEAGVTTVRDAWGAAAGLRRAFASGAFPGPRLQVSTTMLSQSGGHGDLSRHPLGQVIAAMSELPAGTADGVDGVRRAARLRIAAGADWLKVAACGWTDHPGADPEATQFTIEELRAAVEEAEVAGIHGVMAHTQGPRSIRNALAAGIRSIEHADLIDEEGLARLKALDAVLVAQPPWSDEDGPGSTSDGGRYVDVLRAQVRAAAAAGVRVALGSDCMGDALPHFALSHLAASGLGPLGAIRAATIEGATLLGVAEDTGSIGPGKSADILLFDGDPLGYPEQWSDPERVVFVMARGRVMADRLTDR